jgi:hypothetical protein
MTNKVGRPPLFNTAEELQEAVNNYFTADLDCHWTISGLALHLGFTSRYSLYDYEKRDEYSHIIKTARHRIENRIESLMLYGKQNKDYNLAGGMLWLKTHAGYTDRQVDRGDNKDVADVNVPARQSRAEWEKQQREKNGIN